MESRSARKTPKKEMKRLDPETVDKFRSTIGEYYMRHGRQLPWRTTNDPYEIMVSEFMLQQTQVQRVASKYQSFLRRFPNVESLAAAALADILASWSGLGYNRRALALARTAKLLVARFDGIVPASAEELARLPGIGPATAGAICAFAFNLPVVFVETNIRTVFIHFFFRDAKAVHDKEIAALVEQTLDRADPRRWYYGLMDYGVMLKGQGSKVHAKSVHYRRQGKFDDSDRQIRGRLIRAVVLERVANVNRLVQIVSKDPRRALEMLDALIDEGFLRRSGDLISVADAAGQEMR
ncbi:MAG: A/G-specific adenine glycosylase [Desulfomonilaceae bacterium]